VESLGTVLAEECKIGFIQIFKSIPGPFFVSTLLRDPEAPVKFPHELSVELFRYLDYESIQAWIKAYDGFAKYTDSEQLQVKKFVHPPSFLFWKEVVKNFWEQLSVLSQAELTLNETGLALMKAELTLNEAELTLIKAEVTLMKAELTRLIQAIYRYFPQIFLFDLWEKIGKKLPVCFLEALANNFPGNNRVVLFSPAFGYLRTVENYPSDSFFKVIDQRLDQEPFFLADTERLIFGLPGAQVEGDVHLSVDLLPKLLKRCRSLRSCVFQDNWWQQSRGVLSQLPDLIATLPSLETLSIFIPADQELAKTFRFVVNQKNRVQYLILIGGGYLAKDGTMEWRLVDRAKDAKMSFNKNLRKSQGELAIFAEELKKFPYLRSLDIYGITDIIPDDVYALGKFQTRVVFHSALSYGGDPRQTEFLLRPRWKQEASNVQKGLEKLKMEGIVNIMTYVNGNGQATVF
jgi:hypothetical protein